MDEAQPGPGRSLSTEPLPSVDEHAVAVSAAPVQVWAALVHVLRRDLGGGRGIARALGCDAAELSPGFDGSAGQTLPGFRVVESEVGHRLTLRGRHRFSDYQLTFLLDDGRLRAQTRAAFPGPHGRVYRAAVIGSGGHRVVTRRLLRRIARQAA